jgi:antitoxin (DNA-binding transcriptional repressor) of toxin-antitoxin stability system
MVVTTIVEMQQDFFEYLRRVEQGETIILVRGDRPVAEVRPVEAAPAQPRPYGLCAGEFVVPDDLDQPLPDDILTAFEGP